MRAASPAAGSTAETPITRAAARSAEHGRDLERRRRQGSPSAEDGAEHELRGRVGSAARTPSSSRSAPGRSPGPPARLRQRGSGAAGSGERRRDGEPDDAADRHGKGHHRALRRGRRLRPAPSATSEPVPLPRALHEVLARPFAIAAAVTGSSYRAVIESSVLPCSARAFGIGEHRRGLVRDAEASPSPARRRPA